MVVHVRKVYRVACVVGDISVAPAPLVGRLKLPVPAERHAKDELHVALARAHKDVSKQNAFERHSVVAECASSRALDRDGVLVVTIFASGLWWQVDYPAVWNLAPSSFPRIWVGNNLNRGFAVQ